MTHYAGIDPGKSGAIAIIDADGNPVGHVKLKETIADVARFLEQHNPQFAVLEQVGAMPRQGVSSTFKFGQSYGACEAILVCTATPFERVTPAKWQAVLRCRSKGDKNVTKRRAQELFPSVKMTHAIADAYLLAEQARRLAAERFPIQEANV